MEARYTHINSRPVTTPFRDPDTHNRHEAGYTHVSLPFIVALVGYVLAIGSRQILHDPDTLWHLATGRWILDHGIVPRHDIFSYTMPAAPWVAHEWLSETILGGVFLAGGWSSVQMLCALVYSATLAILTRYVLEHLAPQNAISMMAVSMLLVASHLLARPHVFVWPLLVVWSIELARAVAMRRAPSLWLIGVMLVWVNMHGSFVLGLVIAGAFGVEALWCASSLEDRRDVLRGWLPVLLASTGITLVNPQGWHAIGHVVNVMGMRVTLDYVREWQSTDFHRYTPLMLWIPSVFVLAVTGRLRLNLARAGILLGVLYLALKHMRYQSLLGLLSPVLLSAAIGAGSVRDGENCGAVFHRSAPGPLQRLVFRQHPRSALLAWLAVLGISFATARYWSTDPSVGRVPERALLIADSLNLGIRVFNHYDFGGYLIYRGRPVFVDGRADMYGDEFVRMVRDAMLLSARDSLPAVLDRYKITWTLLRPNTPAAQLLDYFPGWTRIYGDSIAVVHARRM